MESQHSSSDQSRLKKRKRLSRKQVHESPSLIPQHIIDHASQRLALVSLFFALQSWKIYDILLIKADAYAASTTVGSTAIDSGFLLLNNFTFVLKYALIDGIFFWFLPVLNVPLLSFLPAFTILLTVGMNAVNFLLTSQSAVPLLSSMFVPVWNFFFRQRELTILGDSVAPRSVLEVNSHFRGRYTVQYLPESSVALNPFAFSGLCLESADSIGSSLPVKLPIMFNTTSEIGFMQIEHISPLNVRTLLNYTRRDVKKLTKGDFSRYSHLPSYVPSDDRIFYAEVDVSAPGRYKIHSVSDVDGLVIRSHKSDFTVGACPEAKFSYPGPEQAYEKYVCLRGDTSLLNWSLPLVSATGIMPLTVEISVFGNEKLLSTFNSTLVLPEQKQGMGWLEERFILRNVVEQELLRLQLPLSAGNIKFHVNSVADATGVRKMYNPASRLKDVDFMVQLKNSATIKLVDQEPSRLLTNERQKSLQLVSDVPLAYPLIVSVQFTGADSLSRMLNYTFKNTEEFRAGISVSEPGHYMVVQGKDHFCPCLIDKSVAPILLTRPLPPSVVIKEKALTDKCVGTIGYEFGLLFTGSAPFEVVYEVYKNVSNVIKPVLTERGLKEHKRRSSCLDISFQYLPTQEGNYIIVFKGIKDVNYNDQLVSVPLGSEKFSFSTSRRSSFTFFKNTHVLHKTIKLCKSGIAKVPVYLDGNFPFSFKYEVVNANTGEVVELKLVKDHYDEAYVIESPSFNKGGEYRVQVKDVSDKLGCPATGLALEVVKILARDDVPQLSFSETKNYTIVEGDSVRVPVALKSSREFSSGDKIVYRVTTPGDESRAKVITVPASSELKFDSEGVYTLESFTNNGCAGEIAGGAQVKIDYHAKPSLVLVPEQERLMSEVNHVFRLSSLCQSTQSHLKVKFSGKKPFDVQYLIQFPNGKTKNPVVSIDNTEVDIPLPSSQKGAYSIKFTNVFDALYSRDKLGRLSYHMPSQEVTYEIQGAPDLTVEKKYIQICETQVEDLAHLNIPVTFTGQPPFQIHGRIAHDLSGKTHEFNFENVYGSRISFNAGKFPKELKDILSVGEHLVAFDRIVDANGCEHRDLGEGSQFRLSVTAIPSISRASNAYCCVGDYIAYNMSGIAPFKVFYNFNGRQRRAESGARFTRLALRPGKLAIVALQDSSAGLCLVNYTSNSIEALALELDVYDLPSVEISHGDSIIKNLHEGDQTGITFKFTGTPPFLVTYVRTVTDDKPKSRKAKGPRRVVDTKTIDEIWDYEHTEVVSLEGTYDAIKVRDAFCQAQRDISEILER